MQVFWLHEGLNSGNCLKLTSLSIMMCDSGITVQQIGIRISSKTKEVNGGEAVRNPAPILWSQSVAAPQFVCRGIEGEKCNSAWDKTPRICQKWLIFIIFLSSDWGKSLQLGGKCPPCPILCCHCSKWDSTLYREGLISMESCRIKPQPAAPTDTLCWFQTNLPLAALPLWWWYLFNCASATCRRGMTKRQAASSQ